jgi:methionine-rich copper-binding protein CopC
MRDQVKRFTRVRFLFLAFMMLLVFQQSAYAQHFHGRRNTVELSHETVPRHDEVLVDAPENLILRFGEYVRLVKLTLKAEDVDTVDVHFSYRPQANRVFIQEIPELAPATYYTAEWAAINADNIMVYGFFCFSFGPDAVVPTTVIPVDDSRHIMVPDYRLPQGDL